MTPPNRSLGNLWFLSGLMLVILVSLASGQTEQPWPPDKTRDLLVDASRRRGKGYTLERVKQAFGLENPDVGPVLVQMVAFHERTSLRGKEMFGGYDDSNFDLLVMWLAESQSREGLALAREILENPESPRDIWWSFLSFLGRWNDAAVGEIYSDMLSEAWKAKDAVRHDIIQTIQRGIRRSLREIPTDNRAITLDLCELLQRIHREQSAIVRELGLEEDYFNTKVTTLRHLGATLDAIEKYNESSEEDPIGSSDSEPGSDAGQGDEFDEGKTKETPRPQDDRQANSSDSSSSFPVVAVVAAVLCTLVLVILGFIVLQRSR